MCVRWLVVRDRIRKEVQLLSLLKGWRLWKIALVFDLEHGSGKRKGCEDCVQEMFPNHQPGNISLQDSDDGGIIQGGAPSEGQADQYMQHAMT